MAESNGNGSLEGLSDLAFEIARRRQAAAADVVALLEEQFEGTFQSHAASMLQAAAWLAGTSLYRSLRIEGELAPGTSLLSEDSDAEGLKLLKVFMFLIQKDGFELKPDDYAADIPPEQQSRLAILEIQEQFQDRYNAIMKRHGFDFLEGAKTGAVACARMVKIHCLNRTDLEPKIAASIVSLGFVDGSKTVPARLKEGNS